MLCVAPVLSLNLCDLDRLQALSSCLNLPIAITLVDEMCFKSLTYSLSYFVFPHYSFWVWEFKKSILFLIKHVYLIFTKHFLCSRHHSKLCFLFYLVFCSTPFVPPNSVCPVSCSATSILSFSRVCNALDHWCSNSYP